MGSSLLCVFELPDGGGVWGFAPESFEEAVEMTLSGFCCLVTGWVRECDEESSSKLILIEVRREPEKPAT